MTSTRIVHLSVIALLYLTSALPILAEPNVLRSYPSNFTLTALLANPALNNTSVKWAYGTGFNWGLLSSLPEAPLNSTLLGIENFTHITFNLQNGTLTTYYPLPDMAPSLAKLDGPVLVQVPPRFPQPNITCTGDFQDYVCQQDSRFSLDPPPGGQRQFPSEGYGLGSVHAWTLEGVDSDNEEYDLMPAPLPPDADSGWFACGGSGGTEGKSLSFGVWKPGNPIMKPDYPYNCEPVDALRVKVQK